MFNFYSDSFVLKQHTVNFVRSDANTYIRFDENSTEAPQTIDIKDMSLEVKQELAEYREDRPEAAVYDLAYDDVASTTPNADIYDTLLYGCLLLRARRQAKRTNKPFDESDVRAKVTKCLTWLHSTDFYKAPASTQYHEAYAGGLLRHSLCVARQAAILHHSDIFPNRPLDSVILIALIHDWCKINLYTSYQKNVKNEQTGQWEQVEAFKISDTKFSSFGHGVSSLYMAMKFITLTEEEALAIRWHMGEYNVADNEMNDLHYANENFPLVFLLQFADRLAITNYIH